MSCEDIPSLLDLQKVKKHADDFGRLMGTGEGDSTNEVTGQVRPTYNKVINDMNSMIVDMNSEFDAQILNMGFTHVGTFAAGATLTNPRQTLLWDIADGGDGQEYGWSGSFLPSGKVVPPGSTPASTGGISVGAWMSRFDPELRVQVREALRRSYAEAGYNLVDGSFEAGGTLVNANDVLLQERTGKAFSGPAGTVAAGTVPSEPDYTNRGDETLRSALADPNSTVPVGGVEAGSLIKPIDSIATLRTTQGFFNGQQVSLTGYHAGSTKGGGILVWDAASTAADDGGVTFAVASVATGRWVRQLDGFITPEMFGAFGDGITDDTVALVAAVDKSAEYTLVMNGQYRKDAATRIEPPSGAKIEGAGSIKLLPHNAGTYQIFHMQMVGDITIKGITVDGNRDENSATGGEYGMGFNLRGTTGKVTLDNVTVIDCWGDGVYIGEGGGQGCEHVEIIKPHIRNCRRQGISVIAVDRLDIDGGLIEEINGTSPEAGIDIEPNYETNKVRQVRVRDLEIRNTARNSVTVVLTNVGLTEEYETDIEFTNLRVNRDINVSTINDMVKGRIFIDFTSKDANSIAFRTAGIRWPSTLDMTLRPRIHNHNMGNYSGGDGCAFFMSSTNQSVDRRGPRIIDLIITEDAPRSRGVAYSSGSFKDTRIVDPIAAPTISSDISSSSLYPYEAVKIVGSIGTVKRRIGTATRVMGTIDFTSGVVVFSGTSNGNWTLPAGTSLGTSSVIVYTSERLIHIYPPSGGNFVGLAVDERVTIPAQPGSGVKITPLGNNVFGAETVFYSGI